MKVPPAACNRESGFTAMELMVVIAIIGIMAAIAIPGFSTWLPNYRLKTAARDLYSNMQKTKVGAIKSNSDWAIVFDPANKRYRICSDDGGEQRICGLRVFQNGSSGQSLTRLGRGVGCRLV